jgi:hypothetical protein
MRITLYSSSVVKEDLPGGLEGYVEYGTSGGEFADPPPWVPDDVKERYRQAWEAAKAEHGEDEYLNETGFTIVFTTFPGSRSLSNILGIDSFTIDDPIEFEAIGPDGESQSYWIYGGVAGA